MLTFFLSTVPHDRSDLYERPAAGDRTRLRDTAVHALPTWREHWLVSGHSQNAPQEEDALRASISGPTTPQRARPSGRGKVRNVLWTDSAHLCPCHLMRREQVCVFVIFPPSSSSSLERGSEKSHEPSWPEQTGPAAAFAGRSRRKSCVLLLIWMVNGCWNGVTIDLICLLTVNNLSLRMV